ncbi:DNA type IV secretion system protein ComB10 [Helicobacter ailurogastricus]|uniref:Inner membrane protein forms channel for type IV secretion of T-DNA complex (VirB10) n=1 Tax=Helicobacter ailurogastricus TaxID=1578720 RepID=A0A0K2Y751_9HELI|nr:DNA type IV secretion system protein ComB10 [Helicobacter ailurogastricus]CRI32389.1 inner membrane protein forms channel for type IV secretion of T-DNA complex (VirB10) [Helicobacter ailurogastricus]
MKPFVKKALFFGGAMVAVFVASLILNKPKKAPEVLDLKDTNYPLADYLFTPPPKEPPPKEDPKIAHLQALLQENAKEIANLKAQLEQAKKAPPPQEVEPPQEAQPQEEQEQELEPAEPTQEELDIENALNERIQGFEESQEKEIDYGASHFENLKTHDLATHENRLLRTITADKMIPAFLVTPISSQLAGKVVAQVESDIFANMGRAVLIPKGSKVIGYYSNNNKIGEYRLDIVWSRIITPQGVNITLTNAKGADVKGYSGLVGQMITHNFQRYGMPLLVSTLSNGLLIALTSALANKTGKNNLFGDFLLMQLTRQTGMGLNQIIAQILKDKSNLKPIIIVREGSRVFISPNLDIFFPTPTEGEVVAKFFKHNPP